MDHSSFWDVGKHEDRVAEKYSVPWNINRYESPSYLLNYVFSPQFKIASPLSSDILSVENLLALQSVIITASSYFLYLDLLITSLIKTIFLYFRWKKKIQLNRRKCFLFLILINVMATYFLWRYGKDINHITGPCRYHHVFFQFILWESFRVNQ